MITDVVVRDGSTVCVRRADERDGAALLEFLRSLSSQRLHQRFHDRPAVTERSVRELVGTPSAGVIALVAEAGGRIVAFASASINRTDPRRAEVAFAVALKGHGVGTGLLEQRAHSISIRSSFFSPAYASPTSGCVSTRQ